VRGICVLDDFRNERSWSLKLSNNQSKTSTDLSYLVAPGYGARHHSQAAALTSQIPQHKVDQARRPHHVWLLPAALSMRGYTRTLYKKTNTQNYVSSKLHTGRSRMKSSFKIIKLTCIDEINDIILKQQVEEGLLA
jgi:hypothetical protein